MARKGEEKRSRIIEAANGLIYHRGYHQTSLADIAEASGVPKGNFYFYFKTKEDILEAVVRQRIDGMADRLKAWEDDFPTAKARLLRMADMPQKDFGDIVEHGCPIGTLSAEIGKQHHHDALAELPVKMFDLLLAWAETQFAAVVGADRARHEARRMLSRLQGAATMAHTYGDKSWIDEEVAATKAHIESL